MPETLKRRTIKAIAWNAGQKYGTLAITFLTNIVLARLLSPDDFGIIGLLAVFIAISNAILDGGFSSSLIQRKEVTQIDYSTIFFWNLGISIIIVVSLVTCSPLIGQYFHKPILTKILKVESSILLINSFCVVQQTILIKKLQFKLLAFRSIIAAILSSTIGIILAYKGYGVWALVWQGILNSFFSAILLWTVAKWSPSMIYSWKSIKKMYKFGTYIFVSSICNTLYINIQSFIIGKVFSISDLGYYSQAKKLESVPVDGTSSVLNAVLFPVYSSVADNHTQHIAIVRKNMNLISFVTVPLMILLIIIAKPLIITLFSSKWEPSIPMFQILCIAGIFTPLNMANTEIFKSIGAGGIYFILQTVKRIIGVIIILCFVPFGFYPLLWASTIIGIISYGINLYFSNKYFGYSYKSQIADILPNIILGIFTGILVKFILYNFNMSYFSNIGKLVMNIILFILIYCGASLICKMRGPKLIRDLLR